MTFSALGALEAHSSSLTEASRLSFDSIKAQLSQLIGHVNNISAHFGTPAIGLEVPEARLDNQPPSAQAVQQVVRVAQHATQQYASHGRLQTDLIVIDSPGYRALSVKNKHTYVRHLVFLRFFV